MSIFLLFAELKTQDDWMKHKFAQDFDLSHKSVNDIVPRIDCRNMSQAEFIEKYEKPRIPVVITNSQDHWMANKKWTLQVSSIAFGFIFV